MEKREDQSLLKNPVVVTVLEIAGLSVLIGGVVYVAHKAGVKEGLNMAVNTCPPCEDAIVIARDCLAQNPEIAENLFYTAEGKKDLLVDILKGMSNKAGIYLERLGDVVPEGVNQTIPPHVVRF